MTGAAGAMLPAPMGIERITILGAETMGHGIAQIAATSGHSVVLHDVSGERVDSGLRAIRASLEKLMEKGKLGPEDRSEAIAKIRGMTDLAAAVAEAELVIEAAPESLATKRDIFAKLG